MSGIAETTYDVTGMTCASCAKRVEKAIGRVEGVREVSVDLVRERARVVGTARDAELAESVAKAGYALVRRDAASRPPERPAVDARTGAAIGIALALLAVDLGAPRLFGDATPWIGLGVASAATFGLGAPIFTRALRLARARDVAMETLVGLGATAALALSLLSLVAGGHAAHGHSDASVAALVIAIVLGGRAYESAGKRRAARELDALLASEVGTARVTRHGATSEIPITELREGDLVHVAPFGVVPADGAIESEHAWLDEAALTGESKAVERTRGATVTGGVLAGPTPIDVRVTAVGAASVRGRLEAETAAALARPPAQAALADRASRVIVPLALVLAVVTLGARLALGAPLLAALRPAIDVLVIACPCALGLATPAALVAALARAAREGIVVRDAARFVELARATRLFFDKTGTLTEGKARVIETVSLGDVDERETLRDVAAIEAGADHPIGHALFLSAMERGIAAPEATEVRAIPGSGVEGSVEGRRVRVERVTTEREHALPPRIAALRATGASLALATIDDRPAAVYAVRDRTRPGAARALAALGRVGLAPEMLSGDHEAAARIVGAEVGLAPDAIHGDLRPEAKVARVAAARGAGQVVAFVGDGVNDAPALAAADVGIAIGGGSGAAIRAAALTLKDGDLARIAVARALARATTATLRGNLVWAFAYNALAMPAAALGTLDLVGGAPVAAAAMAFSSIAVLAWSTRLARLSLPDWSA